MERFDIEIRPVLLEKVPVLGSKNFPGQGAKIGHLYHQQASVSQ
jgi:hypothetical protein